MLRQETAPPERRIMYKLTRRHAHDRNETRLIKNAVSNRSFHNLHDGLAHNYLFFLPIEIPILVFVILSIISIDYNLNIS